MQNLSVTTPVGPVGIANLGFDVGVNGVVADGMLHEGFRVEGLTLPPGLVPPFATDLVPQSFALDFKVSDFNLADPARMLLDMIDLNEAKPTTPEENAEASHRPVAQGGGGNFHGAEQGDGQAL